jgi:hypothetical protein
MGDVTALDCIELWEAQLKPSRTRLIMFTSFGLLLATSIFAANSHSWIVTLLRGVLIIVFIIAICLRWISGAKRFAATRNDLKLGLPKWKFYLLVVGVGVPLLFGILTEVGDYTSRRMIVYVEGLRAAQVSAPVRDSLGNNLQVGWPIGLNAEVSDQTGHAEINVPLRGSLRSGKLHIEGEKASGVWHIPSLYVVTERSNMRIDIPH